MQMTKPSGMLQNTLKKPFFASHSNSRTLCPAMRNLTDDQILCIGERNGMVGMNSYHGFVSDKEDKKKSGYIAEPYGICCRKNRN